jgi:hypothetical protein
MLTIIDDCSEVYVSPFSAAPLTSAFPQRKNINRDDR